MNLYAEICRKAVLLLFTALLWLGVFVHETKGSVPDIQHLHGTWKCTLSDNGLTIEFTNAMTGAIRWNAYGKDTYINFTYIIQADPEHNIQWHQKETNPPDPSHYCTIIMQQTSTNATNEFDKFDQMVAYYTCNYQGTGPAILQLTRMWMLKKTQGSTSVNCAEMMKPAKKEGEDQKGKESTEKKNEPYDKEMQDEIDKYADLLNKGKTREAEEQKKLVLELGRQAYPERLKELTDQLNKMQIAQANKAGGSNDGGSPNTGSGTGTEDENPEGWKYLLEYEKKLNEYISEVNKVIKGGNPSRLLALAEELNKLDQTYADAIKKLNKKQWDVLVKLTDRFADVMLKVASDQLAALQEIGTVNYASEAAGNDYISQIKTKPVTVPNNTVPAGGTMPAGNGDLSSGGRVSPPEKNGTMKDGTKRPK